MICLVIDPRAGVQLDGVQLQEAISEEVLQAAGVLGGVLLLQLIRTSSLLMLQFC